MQELTADPALGPAFLDGPRLGDRRAYLDRGGSGLIYFTLDAGRLQAIFFP